MADEARTQFGLEELAFLFEALERLGHACMLLGGLFTCYWLARHAEPLCVDSSFAIRKSKFR